MEIYLDNAATTKVFPSVAEVVSHVMTADYGNPSSLHDKGFDAEKYVREARKRIAKTLKVSEKEIVFTSGGTESNNLAIFGACNAKRRRGNHIITSVVEHPSVYNPFGYLENNGFRVTYLPVDANGLVSIDALQAALDSETVFVSIMMVNNEIGAIEPIEELAKIVHSFNKDIVFHVDAIQGYGKLPIYPERMGIDLLSVSGHKLHGPKGIGFLYIRDKVRIEPTMLGGGQQSNMRSGTENVPAIAGLAEAVRVYFDNQKSHTEHLYQCKQHFVEKVEEHLPFAHVNAIFAERSDELSLQKRILMTAPHIVSVSFDHIRSEVLLHRLAEEGFYVSAGSACSSNHPAISGTLKAIGVKDKYLDATLRFSFSLETKLEDIDAVVECLARIVPPLQKYTIK